MAIFLWGLGSRQIAIALCGQGGRKYQQLSSRIPQTSEKTDGASSVGNKTNQFRRTHEKQTNLPFLF